MAVRHALQAELYGLTQNQRNNGATAVNQALDGEAVEEIFSRTVDPNRTVKGQVMLFVEADFSTEGAGTRIFNTARTWASTRAEDAPNGAHSYVRLRSVDDVARTITMRYAESPGWVADTTTEQMRSRT